MELMELDEMTKLIALTKDKELTAFLFVWKLHLDFLLYKDKNEVLTLGFDDLDIFWL